MIRMAWSHTIGHFKRWYADLWPIEKFATIVGIVCFVIVMLAWITHDSKGRQTQQHRPIILERRN